MVLDHGLTHLRAEAVKDVQDPIGHPDLLGPLAQHERGHRGHLTGFGDDAIATGEGRRNFPSEEVQREVPGTDATDDPEWLSQGVVDRPVAHGVAFTGELLGRRGVEAEVLFCAGDVHGGGQRNGLAIVFGFGCGEEVGMGGHLVGEAHQDGAAVSGRPGSPFRESRSGGKDGGLHVVRTGAGDAAIHLSRGWFHIVEPVAGLGGNVRPADQIEDVFHRRTRSAGKEKDRSPRVPVSLRLH